MYEQLRGALFKLEPERAHAWALSALQFAYRAQILRAPPSIGRPLECMGLHFSNRVGLAAGFDKNARHIEALAALGFGFIEVGTVTPRAQFGQPRPRVSRLVDQQALINRMGFPNEGAHAVASRLRERSFSGVLGINIGKNATTPLPRAIDDYVECYRVLAPLADYVVVNVSSPNTQNLRALQRSEQLRPMLEALLDERRRLPDANSRVRPILAKVSPDLDEADLASLARLLVELRIDGVVATNTTISRPSTARSNANEVGGLSGAPLAELALRAIRTLKAASDGRLPIIGVGGIMSANDAVNVLRAGADLVQIYTGLIYAGPSLVREVAAIDY